MSRWTVLVFLSLLPAVAAAQLAPVGVPRGVLRVELGGEFRHADSRFFDGETQDLGASFTYPSLATQLFPTLSASEARIRQIVQDAAYQLQPGHTSTNVLREIGTATIGAAFGLTSGITIFGSVPVVQTRIQANLRFDSTLGNAGFNPGNPIFGTAAGLAQTSAFFTEFDAALAQLSTNLANGVYDANPGQKALAQQALAEGTDFRDALGTVFSNPDAPFVPLASSQAGTGILDSIAGYQATLAGLSIGGFSSQPALADGRVSPEEFAAFFPTPGGPALAFPVEEATRTRLGDIEAGVAWTVVDRWNRGSPGGFRLALEGRVRFPTGIVDRTDDFLDVGTGTGHLGLGVGATADLGTGSFGVRLQGDYLHQFAAELDRRIAGPLEAFPFASRLATVRRVPGALVRLQALPFFRLVNTFAVTAGLQVTRKAEDEVTYATPADSLPGLSAALLAQETDWNLTSFLAGITYQSPALQAPGRRGFPVEASWTIEGPLSSSGGIVAKDRAMRVRLRFYTRILD